MSQQQKGERSYTVNDQFSMVMEDFRQVGNSWVQLTIDNVIGYFTA